MELLEHRVLVDARRNQAGESRHDQTRVADGLWRAQVDVVLVAEDGVGAQLVSARFQGQARSGAFLLENGGYAVACRKWRDIEREDKKKKLSTGGWTKLNFEIETLTVLILDHNKSDFGNFWL